MLSSFYRSKQWISLLDVLKLERVNAEGKLLCEHCGEPIVRAYDCIGHHVIELTEDNYIDTNISLNPDNIKLVHHRCHNKIHNKLAYGESVRRVYLVYGPPLSGKTSWVNEVMNEGDLIIDMDSIWQCISGCDRYIKPGRLNAVVFGIRDKLLDDVRIRLGKWKNAYIIGGYPLISERERLCRTLGAREIFIECSMEECLQRLTLAEDARDKVEWEKYIEDWFRKYGPPGLPK